MVEAELTEIRINELEGEQIIVLTEKGGDRYLPIVIGICEANAIRYHIHRYPRPRPLTQDLLCNVVTSLGGELARIIINDLSGGTFYAQLVIDTGDDEVVVDARPSDAVALAIRVECPIFIEDHVLEKNDAEGL
jgi:bifunctional DNase/RNase